MRGEARRWAGVFAFFILFASMVKGAGKGEGSTLCDYGYGNWGWGANRKARRAGAGLTWGITEDYQFPDSGSMA